MTMTTTRRSFLTTIAAALIADCALAMEATRAQMERIIREQFVGTWRLDSIYEETAEGEDIDQFGLAPRGSLMADRQGNFSFQIMSTDGRRYAAKGPPNMISPTGILEAMTYFGTYDVNERSHKLTLHVVHCLFRSCDNSNRTADLKIHGDTMELISACDSTR
jgi:hypothetical protein